MHQSDILDDLVNLDYDQDEQNKLDEKFKPQTQVDINEPFYKASKISTFIVQSLSVVLGFGACLEVAERFPDIMELIFLCCVSLLVLWELAKRTSLSKIQEIRIKNRYKKVKLKATPYFVASIFLVGGSMYIGYSGAKPVVEKFSQHQVLEDLEELRETYFASISEVQEEFLSASLASKIDTLSKGIRYKHGKKKGELKSAGSNLVADLVELEKGHTQQKNKAVNDLRAEMAKELDQAKERNESIVSEHQAWCSSFGSYAAIGNILCDILLIILLRWCFNHEDNKRKLNRKKKELKESMNEQEKEQIQEKPKKKEAVLQAVKEQEQEMNPIGFGQKEGSLVTENGKEYVLLRMTKGKNKDKLVKRSKSDIKNSINSQSSTTSERTIFLKGLLEKFS